MKALRGSENMWSRRSYWRSCRLRGWPSEYLRAMIFFSFCCLFAEDVAAGIVAVAEGTRSLSWSIVRHVRIEKRVIDRHLDHFIILVTTSSSSIYLSFPSNPPLFFFFRPNSFRSLIPTPRIPAFFVFLFLLSVVPTMSLLTRQSDRNSLTLCG